MPWYYAGPEARPVGPVSLEELQALRARGALLPETYVIVQPALPGQPEGWRRYGEMFPSIPELPSVPAPDPSHPLFPSATATPPSAVLPHPLFPSAAPKTPSPGGPVFRPATPGSLHSVPYASTTNSFCAWGFGLALAGFPCLLCFGLGIFFALGGLVCSVVGLVQLRKSTTQTGRGLAVGGLLISGVTLLLVLVFGVYFGFSSLKERGQTSTEQTSTDTDSK